MSAGAPEFRIDSPGESRPWRHRVLRWLLGMTVGVSRRYSCALVRRALEADPGFHAQTWVWGASGLR